MRSRASARSRRRRGKRRSALDGDISNFNLYYFAEIAVRLSGAGKGAGSDKRRPERREATETQKILQRPRKLTKGWQRTNTLRQATDRGEWPASQHQWATNRSDFIYMGTWIASETASHAHPGFEYHRFPMPAPAPGSIDSVEFIFYQFSAFRAKQNTQQKRPSSSPIS